MNTVSFFLPVLLGAISRSEPVHLRHSIPLSSSPALTIPAVA